MWCPLVSENGSITWLIRLDFAVNIYIICMYVYIYICTYICKYVHIGLCRSIGLAYEYTITYKKLQRKIHILRDEFLRGDSLISWEMTGDLLQSPRVESSSRKPLMVKLSKTER